MGVDSLLWRVHKVPVYPAVYHFELPMGDIHLGQAGIADGIGHYDYLMKLLALGDSDVGKTSLMLRFVDDVFDPEMGTTIGVDFKEKVVNKEFCRM